MPQKTNAARGCSTSWGSGAALAAKRDFPVFVDDTIELFDIVSVSGGIRGLQILLAPAGYLHATKGKLAALGHPKQGRLSKQKPRR